MKDITSKINIRTAFLCPGQGSQYVGMFKDLHNAFPNIQKLVKSADEILGYPLSQICFDGPAEKLRETRYTQPALFLHSAIIYELVKDRIRFDAVAGHSVGEYAALYVAGVLSFEDALNLVSLRGQLVFAAGEEYSGTMFAVLGLDDEKVIEVCESLSEGLESLTDSVNVRNNIGKINFVVPANFNSPGQVVVSGPADYLRSSVNAFKEAGARVVKELQVSGAFHSPLMFPARVGLNEAINSITFKDASVPVYLNVTTEPTMNNGDIRLALKEQLTSPVLWTRIIENMYRDEVRRFIEIGSGNVLQSLVKRIIGAENIAITGDEFEILGLDKLEDLK